MASNVRPFLGRKRYHKPLDDAASSLLTEEQNSLWGSLKAGLVEAGSILELIPCPVALWSRDRRLCVFNDSTRQLLGFCEHDFRKNPSLWTDRILPRDRAAFLTEWTKLQRGEKRISCSYRFLPNHRASEIRLREVSVSYPIRGDAAGVWSLYSEDPTAEDEFGGVQQVRELVRGLTHEIGNSLQAISGEVDLLRMSGALAPENSSAVTDGVKQIRKLAHEIEEYLAPPPLQLRSEEPVTVLNEVIESRQRELAALGIRIAVGLRQPLPRVPLDEQFRSALERVIDFSCALLPQGGELKIEAGLQRMGEVDYIELNLATASPTSITVEEQGREQRGKAN
jgi:signal transduction histidine kinase